MMDVLCAVGALWIVYNILRAHKILAKRTRALRSAPPAVALPPSFRISRDLLDKSIAAVRQKLEHRRGLLSLGSYMDECITSEAVVMLGGGLAVLLQLAHPFVAWGIADHSYTHADTKKRFYNTFRAVFALSFGTNLVAESAALRVFRLHTGVSGSREGITYAATDHGAACWVLATLIDTALVTYALYVRELTRDERHAHLQFHLKVCGMWGVQADVFPQTIEAFDAYMAHMRHSDQLRVTPEAREMKEHLFSSMPLGLAEVSGFMLPEHLSKGFGFGGGNVWINAVFAGLVRSVYILIPRRARVFTKAARRTARMEGTALPWYNQLGEWFGDRFVAFVLK